MIRHHALFPTIAAIALVSTAQPALAQHVLNVRDADIRAFIRAR